MNSSYSDTVRAGSIALQNSLCIITESNAVIDCGTALFILIINTSNFWRQIYHPLDTVKTQMVSNIGGKILP